MLGGFGPNGGEVFANIAVHILNLVFILLETLFNRALYIYALSAAHIAIGLLYLCVGWIIAAVRPDPNAPDGQFWPYPFLRFSNPNAWVWYLGLILGFFVIYNFCWALHKYVRDPLIKKRSQRVLP